jgi:hypothetical protein
LFWKKNFRLNLGATGGASAHRIRHEAKTEKTIFDEFRSGTFSHSLGMKPEWG